MSMDGHKRMDGDSTAKIFDRGANSAINNAEFGSGIHEAAAQREPAGEKTTGSGTPAFSKDGAIGRQFQANGSIGSMGEMVGGPLSSSGMIGKHFNANGAIGGSIHNTLGKQDNM